jgi:predicted TIM-barrel fold metal-dependent hydrolase
VGVLELTASTVIDVHAHVFESKTIGAWSKEAYEIWEYGAKEDVRLASITGDIEDLREAMRAGDIAHAVVVNAFSIDEWRGRWLEGLDEATGEAVPLGQRLIEFNRWLVETVAPFPDITPFVAVDPWILSNDELAVHLIDMQGKGARGVKVHPIDQRFVISDPRMVRIGELCVELGLCVLSHSGTSRGGVQFAEPSSFDEFVPAVPGLHLVVAHLGGGSWQQIRELAERHGDIAFDLSEIVAWVGAPNAPTETELVRLIRDVGVERVMFGSDFPWYDPGEMVKAVRTLPGLTDDELAAILGGNAVRILRLPA